MTETTRSIFFWHVTPRSMVENFQTFRGKKWLGSSPFFKMKEALSSENSVFVKIFIQINFREGLIMTIFDRK